MEEQVIRRLALERLCKDAGGYRALCAERNKVLPEKDQLNPDYMNQILQGTRNMGERSARNMERKLGLDRGALDIVDGSAPAVKIAQTPNPSTPNMPRDEEWLLELFRSIEDKKTRLLATEYLSALARGAIPSLQASKPDTKELFSAWEAHAREQFKEELAEYNSATNAKALQLVEAKIGGRVVRMINQRQATADPPTDHPNRRSGEGAKT